MLVTNSSVGFIVSYIAVRMNTNGIPYVSEYAYVLIPPDIAYIVKWQLLYFSLFN